MEEKIPKNNNLVTKKAIYDVFLLIVIFLLTTANFYDQYVTNVYLLIIIKILLQIGFIAFTFYFVRKNKLFTPPFQKIKRKIFLFLPFIFMTVSNLIVIMIAKTPVQQVNVPILLIDGVLLNLLLVTNEELLFRVLLFSLFLERTTPAKSFIYSSLVFAGLHLINISSLASITPVLTQVVYTFFLGLLCSFAIYVTKNFVVPVVFHFAFNFFNHKLFSALFSYEVDVLFYTVNSIIGILALAYGICLYYYLQKKGNKIDVSNTLGF